MKCVRPGILVLVAVFAASCSRLETSEQRAERNRLEGTALLALEAPAPDASPTLRLSLVRPTSWDPIELSLADQDAVIVSDLLFDGLTEATADGRLVPALATGWSSTDDYSSWTFALDTERTTADAVRSSFERLRTEAPDSAATLLAGVVRIDVVDSATVRFVLESSNAGFAWLVSGLPFSISDDSGTASGRYRLVEDDSEQSVLVNDQSDDAVSVIIQWADDHETAQAAAAAGQVDGAVVPIDEAASAASEVGAPVLARSITRFYVLDPTSAALADIRVRQAILAALDTKTLIDDVALPAFATDGLVAPTVAGFADDACGATCGPDTERAAALLAEVGSVSTIRVGYSSDGERALAEAMAVQLDGVGITAEAVEIEASQLSAAIANSVVDMVPYGWVAPAGSVDAILPALLSGVSSANPIGMISDEVDQSIAAAAGTGDDSERWALLQTAHRLALEQAVFVPVAAAQNRFVVSPAFTEVQTRADGSIEIRSLP